MTPAQPARATQWVYRGVWGALASWFRVPADPPALPSSAGEPVESLRPAPNFLRYLKIPFWLVLILIDGLLTIGWIAILVNDKTLGIALFPVYLVVAFVPDIIAYIAIHLRYDTTWYVLSDRSLRIRRGIMSIRESTITFENVQNVKVSQGPLQRYYGIANVVVETAGGGSAGVHGGGSSGSRAGVIEGVADAVRIRDLIMAKARRSRAAGLGDDRPDAAESTPAGWSAAHLEALRAIRDEAAALRRGA